MIEFRGTLSDTCTKEMMKRETITKLIVFTPLGVAFALPFFIIGLFKEPMFHAFAALAFIICLCGAGPAPKNKYHTIFPTSVKIDGEDLSISGDGFFHERGMEQVKKVIDFGDWYQIVFYFPHKNLYFICQKDLIVQGTIQEFEELFGDLIVPA